MSFDEFNLNPKCVQLLKKQGITDPTPVQEKAIPVALEGRDVVAIAQTGTGKTLGFVLPALTRLSEEGTKKGTRMLIITPTRELAHQVREVAEPLAQSLGLRTACVYGGVGMHPQVQALRKGCDIIIATPGRLLDHIERGNARLGNVSSLVLDEADRMLDMGFLPDIKRILSEMPKERQTMMFSATFPSQIQRLTASFMNNPVRIEVAATATPSKSVRQNVYTVVADRKLELLTKILDEHEVGPTLIFMRTKHRTDRVAKALNKQGIKAQAIHGGRSQAQRQRALDGFRSGRHSVLVATDVAARGIDVEGITHVVNFDIPNSPEDYIHRIGRTARANADGDAITFVSPNEFMELGSIEKILGKAIPRQEWEGSVQVLSCGNKPKKRGGGGGGRRGNMNSRRGGNRRLARSR